MNKTEITKIVEKELLEFFDAKSLLRHNKEIMEFSIEATLKAINYSPCCKSDSEQLRDKKLKDLVNLAKSELSNYNKQKVLKVETIEGKNRTKLLKKIIDLQNP